MKKIGALVCASAVMAATAVPVSAQTHTATVDPSSGAVSGDISSCPAVQVIQVGNGKISAEQGGLFSSYVFPAQQAVNGPSAPADGGITVEPTDSDSGSGTTLESVDSIESDSDWQTFSNSTTAESESDSDWQTFTESTPVATEPQSTTVATESVWESTTAKAEAAGVDNVIGRSYVTYTPSTGGKNDALTGLTENTAADNSVSYEESLKDGFKATLDTALQVKKQCPSTKLFLTGVGQGAQIVADVATTVGRRQDGNITPEDVAGVALIGDPSRSEGLSQVTSGASSPAPVPGTEGDAVLNAGTFDAANPVSGGGLASNGEKQTFGELSDRTVSYCVSGDVSCAVEADTPLAKLVKRTNEAIDTTDPQATLTAISDTYGPALAMSGLDAINEDIDFGPGGFEIKRASSVDDTFLGRVASYSDGPVEQQDMQQKALAAGAKLGGMALGVGITIAKDVLTPDNLAQIAAAGAISPAAGAAVAGGKILLSSAKLLTPAVATGLAGRVVDEAGAMGIENPALAEIVTQAAQYQALQWQDGYASTQATSDGRSATDATADWIVAAAVDTAKQQGKKIKEVDTDRFAVTDATFTGADATNALNQIEG